MAAERKLPEAVPEVDAPTTKPLPLLVVVSIGAAIWMVPSPEGVSAQAWQLLAIFVATIAGIILKPLPLGAVSVISIAVVVLSGTLGIEDALSGFSHTVVWLIVTAFFIAHGVIETGLGMRIAYLFMAVAGRRTLGLGYSLIATDLVLAPAMPSNTARGGAVIFPLLRSLGKVFSSEAHDGTARKISAFLTLNAYQGTVITSAMFMTAMAANPLSAAMAAEMGIEITWSGWASAAIVPGCLSLILVPLLVFWLYPPEIRETPEAVAVAKAELTRMGSLKRAEWIMLGVFLSMLLLWALGSRLGLHPNATALGGVSVLLLTGVVTWKALLHVTEAWNTLIWFSTLVMMASFLGELGLTTWFSQQVVGLFEGIAWMPAFFGLSMAYFFSHYFFASNTAHISAMYAPFLAVALAVGTPPMLAALVLAFFSNLYSSLTHYGTAPGPIYFGSGTVELTAWWRIGLIVSFANIIIWLGLGGLWWKLLGLW